MNPRADYFGDIAITSCGTSTRLEEATEGTGSLLKCWRAAARLERVLVGVSCWLTAWPSMVLIRKVHPQGQETPGRNG